MDKIKVKDVVKGSDTCQHYRVTFEMSNGSELTVTLHSREGEDVSEEEFVTDWLKFQFKHKANKTKLKGKTVIEVEE